MCTIRFLMQGLKLSNILYDLAEILGPIFFEIPIIWNLYWDVVFWLGQLIMDKVVTWILILQSRKPRNFTPLSTLAERKSRKNGVHHAVFTSRLDRYVGDWRQDLKEGKGFFLTIKGKLYEGDWHKGYRHGFGTLSHRRDNGTFTLMYRGDWVYGKPEGIGWWWYDNGDVYFGFWKRGRRHGFGKMWYADGTYYVGYWNKDLKGGLGMFVQKNGNRYEGHWEDNTKNGLGRFYHMHTGQLQEGVWAKDVCVKSKMSDIIIRQFCDLPTGYPIPLETLSDSRAILEDSEIWLNQNICDIDKQLQFCIDQLY